VAEPGAKGFGTLLLERLFGHQLGGKVDVVFSPEGLRVGVEATLPRAMPE
jgi:two-component sensor histidine kinase